MYILEKLQNYGVKWFLRRVMRESMQPTTRWGQYFKPFAPWLYYALNKPIHFVQARRHLKESSKDTLYFFYDLEVEPITYDFVWALSVANAEREARNLSTLHVVFVPGTVMGFRKELPAYAKVIDHDARLWRVDAILLPSLQLLPCPYGMTFCATRIDAIQLLEKQAKSVYPTKYNVTFPVPYAPEQAVAFGQSCMALRATHQAKAYVYEWLQRYSNDKKLIVITLREYDYTLERNSNIDAWVRFANELNTDQFFIVFVPDTEQAMRDMHQELQAFHTFMPACWNLGLRAALYELAFLNLGVNTGPMSLCWFNARCRYITFKTAVKNVPEIPLEMITSKGFVPGENPAFCNRFQKWVWEEDEYEVISREFELMCQALNS